MTFMEPWIVTFGAVILGWALGLATPLFFDWRKERRKRIEIQRAIAVELGEVAYRLLLLVFETESNFGNLDRKLLEWMHPLIQKYEGLNPREPVLAYVNELLKQSAADLAQWAAREREASPPHFNYPRIEAAYTTTAAMTHANSFEPDYARRVLDILSHLRMLNYMHDHVIFYERLTFTPGLTEENYKEAIKGKHTAQTEMSKRSRIIVDKITALEQKYPS